MGRWWRQVLSGGLLILLAAVPALAQPVPAQTQGPSVGAAPLTAEEQRAFLSQAEFVSWEETGKGVTRPYRVRLRAGGVERDAVFQSVNVSRGVFDAGRTKELNFRDYFGYNIAAHHLACLLNRCALVPAAVERMWRGTTGSLVWWVEDVAMDEGERVKKRVTPPSKWLWQREWQLSRLFTELSADVDRNQTNLLTTKDWRLVLIDFTRAFRLRRPAEDLSALEGIEADVYDGLRALTAERVEQVAGRWLTGGERAAMLKRRDRILAHFDALVAQKGSAQVVYPAPRR